MAYALLRSYSLFMLSKVPLALVLYVIFERLAYFSLGDLNRLLSVIL